MLKSLSGLKNVSSDFLHVINHPPLIGGDSIPDYWCRVEKDGTHYLFLAQHLSKNLAYPIYSGQSYMHDSAWKDLTLTINGKTIHLQLRGQLPPLEKK